MKQLKYFFMFIFCIMFSCKKDKVVDNQTRTGGNSIDSTYTSYCFNFWKNEFLTRNSMNDTYFNSHISQVKTSLDYWNSGITFSVAYKVTIDWAIIDNNDEFMVKLYSTESAYQYLNIPRDTFLNETQIKIIIDNNVFNSAIGPVKPINHLLYSSYNIAVQAFKDSANSNEILPDRLSYYVPGKFPRKDGNPYFIGSGVINQSENKCINGYFNLVTGKSQANTTVCRYE